MLFQTSKTSKRFLKQAKQAVNVIVSVSVSVNENVIEDENETEDDSVYADEEEDFNVVFFVLFLFFCIYKTIFIFLTP